MAHPILIRAELLLEEGRAPRCLPCGAGRADSAVRSRREEGAGRSGRPVEAIESGAVGFDGVPAADVAIVAGGSHGVREFVQRVGRVLRPQEGKRALVVQIVARDTHEEQQGERRRMALVAPGTV